MKATIGIDAGHGGDSSGTYTCNTVNDGLFEKDFALEQAMLVAKEYPAQMRDLVVNWNTNGFVGKEVALMVMDILCEDGTLAPLKENEKITSNLLMFCDKLPE